MELFNKIKDLREQAFKEGDKFLHSVLTNVFSDTNPVGSAAGTTPDDTSVVSVVKKHLKGVVETLEIYAKNTIAADVAALKEREKAILESLLPQQLSEDQLHSIFNALEPAALKDFMAHLKAFYAGLFDGKLAKFVFDTARAAQVQAAEANQAESAPVVISAPVGDTFAAPVEATVAQVTK